MHCSCEIQLSVAFSGNSVNNTLLIQWHQRNGKLHDIFVYCFVLNARNDNNLLKIPQCKAVKLRQKTNIFLFISMSRRFKSGNAKDKRKHNILIENGNWKAKGWGWWRVRRKCWVCAKAERRINNTYEEISKIVIFISLNSEERLLSRYHLNLHWKNLSSSLGKLLYTFTTVFNSSPKNGSTIYGI